MFHEACCMVKEFQTAAGQPVSLKPVKLEKDRVEIRARWMKGELKEFLEAENIVAQTDALIDLMYYLIGTCVEMGIEPDGPFRVVHASNMEKLCSLEGIKKDADGKVEKPKDWKHPDGRIVAEINKMM